MSDEPSTTQTEIASQQTSTVSTHAAPAVTIEKSLVIAEKSLVIAEKSLVSVSSTQAIRPAGAEQRKSLATITAVTDKLNAHKRNHFTGITYITAKKKHAWKLYFYLGSLTWAVAQTGQERSWHRQLRAACPELLQSLGSTVGTEHKTESLPLQKLSHSHLIKQVQNQQIERGAIATAIENHLCEMLFDIFQEGTLREQYGESPLSFRDKDTPFLGSRFLSVRSHTIWEKTQTEWAAWQDAGLSNCSPNLKPVVSQTQQLKDYISQDVYECLIKLIKDDQCLRDLAVDHGQALLPFTMRIHPFIQQGMIGLVPMATPVPIETVEDTTSRKQSPKSRNPKKVETPKQSAQSPAPQKVTSLKVPQPGKPPQPQDSRDLQGSEITKKATLEQKLPKSTGTKGAKGAKGAKGSNGSNRAANTSPDSDTSQPLVVYIEDSQMDSRTMAGIVQKAGYRYFNIQEPIHAIPLLIEKKPQLIFLDLVMPIANGYEICAQIRRVSSLKKVPIIIVTSNNGLIERIRTRLTGSNGFLSKPINSAKVLKVLNKHTVSVPRLNA